MTTLHLPGFGVEALSRELAALSRLDSKGARVLDPRKLCALFGLRAVARDDSARRIAGHEGGHATVAMELGSGFSHVQVTDGDPALYFPKYEHPDLSLVGNVAGAIGEEMLLGDIDPIGCGSDLSSAFRKALTLSGGSLPDAVELVRDAIEAARNILIERRVAHTALADALLARGSLTHADCVEVVQRAEAGR